MTEEEPLANFLRLLSQPDETAVSLLMNNRAMSQEEHRKVLRQTCQHLFQRIEHLHRIYSQLHDEENGTGGLVDLSELYMGDAETIFGQVDLQNEALHALLKKSVRRLGKAAEGKGGESIRLLEDVVSEDDGRESNGDSDADDGSEQQSDDDGEEVYDEQSRRMQARMERAMAGMEDEDSDAESGDVGPEKDEHKRKQQTSEEETSIEDPAAEELNDGFFDINEMEAFADEEEEYLPDEAYGQTKPEEPHDMRSFHQRQRDGDDFDSGADNDVEENDLLFRNENQLRRRRYREDDEIDALYSLYETPNDDDADTKDAVNMTAADIFGKPSKKYFSKWNARKKSKGRKSHRDDDSWNDYNFDQEDVGPSGWNDRNEDESSVEADEAVAEQDRGGEDAEGLDPKERPGKSGTHAKSVRGRQSEKLRFQTEQLEKELLAEKPWQMTGEAMSMARPVNSLLESTPEFEVATKMAPMITVEYTASLEEVIKERILDEDWDDVIPRELPDIGWDKKRGELPEVSQEKSKLGLGELYEREYLKKAVGYDVDAAEKESEEDKAKNEMKSLFAGLCSKLDALSNYHFAPRPIADEAEVKPITTPAIAMEEVLPLHVSDSRASAPEEIFGSKRGRDGVLMGDSERDQQERKRLRASKKAARRKRRKEKLADERLISRLQPGLGLNNPYEKRKMREELSAARAHGTVTTGQQDLNSKYGASGTFFKRLQEEADRTIQGQKDTTAEKKERPKSNSSSLKL